MINRLKSLKLTTKLLVLSGFLVIGASAASNAIYSPSYSEAVEQPAIEQIEPIDQQKDKTVQKAPEKAVESIPDTNQAIERPDEPEPREKPAEVPGVIALRKMGLSEGEVQCIREYARWRAKPSIPEEEIPLSVYFSFYNTYLHQDKCKASKSTMEGR